MAKCTYTIIADEYTDEMKDRFWSHVPTHRNPKHCWIWQGPTRGGTDYGQFFARDRKHMAHRFAYALAHGTCPKTVVILHSCDTPLCVNPHHLSAGTQQQNIEDCHRRGRWSKGKLSNEQAETIRQEYAAGMSQRQLAHKYQVSQPAILYIVNGKNHTSTRPEKPGLWKTIQMGLGL